MNLASTIVLLALVIFMLRAGYEWRKLESRDRSEATLDSMIRKI